MTWTLDEERVIHPPDKPFCSYYPTCSQRLWPKFDKYLRSRGLDYELARQNVWFPSRTVDGYDRLVVPGTSDEPGNLYWQARLIGNAEAHVRRWESPHGVRRGRSVCLVWPKRNIMEPLVASVVVEGPMDALAAAGEGYLAVALMGVIPSQEVLDLTNTLLRGTICVMVMDMGAEKPMAENSAALKERGLSTRLVCPYPYKDLAEVPKEKRRGYLC